jgi:proteic killer suppression protein
MIRSFKPEDGDTERLWNGERIRAFQAFEAQARRRLAALHAAKSLEDLRAIRSNDLHPLTADRKGRWAIRINMQWRVCFRWEGGGVFDVEIVDYH